LTGSHCHAPTLLGRRGFWRGAAPDATLVGRSTVSLRGTREKEPSDGYQEAIQAPRDEARPPRPSSPPPPRAPATRIAAAALHGRVAHRERPAKERRLVPGRARVHTGGALGNERWFARPADEGRRVGHHVGSGRLRQRPEPQEG